MVPRQKPGQSEQVVQTPSNLLYAIRKHWLDDDDDFVIDLAASHENKVVPTFYSEADDSLKQDWTQWTGNCWLNLPFGKIVPWVAKAAASASKDTNIFMLIPASVGSNWWRDYVHDHCEVNFLNGRPTFVGHTTPYPKDLALLIYGPYHRGYYIWRWKA